jgi:hypothetical protein
MTDNNISLKEFGVGQVFNTEIQDALAKLVKSKYVEAKQHKINIGIHAQLIRDLRSKMEEYAPEDTAMLGGIDVFIGIGALKQRAAESWIVDIIVNNIEKPWTLDPTPEPDLPERLRDQIVETLMQELPDIASFEALKERAEQLKAAVRSIAAKKAYTATARMENKIADQLAEGDWTQTFRTFVNQLTSYPSAILRGPVEVGVQVATWKGNDLDIRRGSQLKVRPVNPFDAFPAPNSTNAGNGSYFIERTDFTQGDIYDLIAVPGFSDVNIRAALAKYGEGYQPTSIERSSERVLRDKDSTLMGNTNGDLETLIYNGKVPGKLLIDNGVLVEDPQKHYEAEVWVLGDYTIRAVLNPHPLGKRPLYSTSFVKVDGKFWGKGVIDLVNGIERTCNAACRAMIRNMGYSSGPIGEVVSERLAEGEDLLNLRPYAIYRVGPDLTGSGGPAFKFHNVGVIAGELMTVFLQYMKLADDMSGVPAYVLGNPQVAGAGRTLGGLSMLMGNAAKGIKNVQLNIDMDVITGVVEAFYMYNLKTSDDISIKADAKVVARGATGLLQRELSQSKSTELLQLLTPYVAQGMVDKTAIDYIFREIFKNTGLDVDKIFPDPDKAANMQELQSLLGPQAEAFNRGSSTPQPLPPQSVPQPNPAMASLPPPTMQ